VGIYDKTCPQCMASSTAATARCTCGYLFDSSGSDERSLTLERIAREEKLFEEYLEARLAQAQEAAIVATRAADLDPENQRKAIEASRAKRAAGRAAVGLATQRIKAAQAAHAAGISFAMRSSLTPQSSSVTPPNPVTKATIPVNGATARPAVALRPKDRWTPKHDSNRTMPPLRINDAAPDTQTVTPKFAAAAGRTLSSVPTPIDGAAQLADNGKPPIPVLTMAVPQQALTPAPVRNNGVKVFESKMVFYGSPWRDAAKKMAATAARRVAKAAARSSTKAVKGIGRAAASGAKKAGGAAARGASKAAKHMAKAAAYTAKQAARAVQQRRKAMKVRAARTPPALDAPPVATTPLPTLTDASPKPAVAAGARRSTTTVTRAKAAAPKRKPKTTTLSTPAEQSPSPAHPPQPPAKPNSASVRSVEAKQRPQPTENFRATQAARIEKAITAARQLERKVPAREIECALCSATLSANADRCLCGWRVPNHEREIPALELATPAVSNGNELTVVFSPIECPLCAATIAANTTRCQCGWRVPEGVNELPPVTLSSEEISALSQGAQLDEPSKAR
jgi:hypothetical protein